MLSPKTIRDIYRIFPFGAIWFIFTSIYLLLEKGIMADLETYPSTGNPYQFGWITFISLSLSTFAGLCIGFLEIKILDRFFRRKSFGKKIILKTLIYVSVMIVFLMGISVVRYMKMYHVSLFDIEVWLGLKHFLSHAIFWTTELYIAAIIIGSLFFAEVSENTGMLVLHNFLVGKYYKPVEEERIFMFLDMKSSTTIAEDMGHLKYFEMLRRYYYDMTDSIINFHGEINQYVGDMVVISWTMKNGLKNNNCIECFYDMKTAIQKQSDRYLSKYGMVPEFRAGMHYGKVTTGEIGIIKKDIIFTGDVLNVTSRIEGLCKSHGSDLVISENLCNELSLGRAYQTKELGKQEIRGRNEEIKLVSVEKAGSV
jgi:adenylate cyclase